MKFVSFRVQGRYHSGLLAGSSVVPLLDLELGEYVSLQRAIEKGLSVANVDGFSDKSQSIALSEIDILPPIINPGKIICVGTNYESHRVETAREKTTRPPLFLRTAETLVPDGAPLLCPVESTMFDFEGEIAIVMG